MSVKLSGDWKKFLRKFSSRAREEFQKELGKKVQEQLRLLRRDVIRYVDSEQHGVPNSPLTILSKGSSRPLVDRGDLRESINTRTEVTRTEVRGGVGVLRSSVNADGKKLWNVAAALHEGFVVRVTPKVRAALFAEMRKRRGKKVHFESSEGSRTWRVKGRPFIEDPFKAAEERIKLALGDGVKLTLQKK